MIHNRKGLWVTLLMVLLSCAQLLPVRVMAGEGDEDKKNGKITGTVTTNDGKPAEAVTVKLKGTPRATLTDDDGTFTINNVKPGEYQLEVTLVGYESSGQTVTVEEGKTAKVSIELKLSGTQLETVTVQYGRAPYNARKLSSSLRLDEPILEAPQNIQVVTNKVLVDQQVISMSDGVIRNVSGAMRLEHWADMYANIYARGSRLSPFRNGMNTETSYWSPLTEDMSFTDHIEFVKGPAGFMMSVGDPAGIYNVVTKKPTGVTRGEASFTMGSFDLYRATTDFDGKLDKDGKLLYRLNLSMQTKNSFRAYEYNDRYSIAPVISYKLDDNTVLTAEYVRQHVKSSNVGSYYVFSTKGYAVLPRNFTILDPGIEPTYITDQSMTVSLAHKFDDHWKLNVQAAYYDYSGTGSSMWATSVSADSMIRNVSIWDAAATGKFVQAYVNGDVQTGAIHHRIMFGVEGNSKVYMADWNQSHDLDLPDQQFVFANPSYGSPSNGYPVWDRSKPLVQRAGQYAVVRQSLESVYAQDELGFFQNKLRVTVGGRYTHVINNNYGTPSTANKVVPRFGLSYSIDESTSVYGIYDQAFVPQSGIRRDGKSVEPMTGNNMEVGVKRDFAAGKWTTTLAAYRTVRNNGITSDPSDPTGRYILQIGQSRAQGIEFDVRGAIIPGLTLTANYAYTDNEITKSYSDGEKGSKIPGYAKHTVNAWINYQLMNGVLKGFGVSGGMTFLGTRSTWSWPGATGQQPLPDYTKLDGGIFWERGPIRISCNVYNLADKYLYSGSAYAAYYYWQAEPPRNYRFSINYRF